MEELGSVVPPLTGRVFDWLAARGIASAGPPFWRYVVVDMETKLELQTGVPLATQVEGNGEIRAGVLPAGRYAKLCTRAIRHSGDSDARPAAMGRGAWLGVGL
jgi:hypothetical protein